MNREEERKEHEPCACLACLLAQFPIVGASGMKPKVSRDTATTSSIASSPLPWEVQTVAMNTFFPLNKTMTGLSKR